MVIGIAKYQHPDVPDVEFAVNDAVAIKRMLVETLGYREDRVLLRTNEDASVGRLKSLMRQELPARVVAGKSDVFVYYSGHGAPNADTREASLIPWDYDPRYALTSDSAYPLKEFYSDLGKLKARSVTVTLDACFSGQSESGMVLKDVSPPYIEVPLPELTNGVVISATGPREVATWDREHRHGLLTYYLLRALRGEAADEKGRVTAAQLESYLKEKVPQAARELRQRNQTPQVTALEPGRLLAQLPISALKTGEAQVVQRFGSLDIAIDVGGELLIDGVSQGVIPAGQAFVQQRMAAGPHQIEVRKENYRPVQEQVIVLPDQPLRKTYQLAAILPEMARLTPPSAPLSRAEPAAAAPARPTSVPKPLSLMPRFKFERTLASSQELTSECYSLVFSPDARWLACVDSEHDAVKLWEVGIKREARTLPHENSVMAVAFSPDSRYLASGTLDGIEIWEVTGGQKLGIMRSPHGGAIASVAFSPGGDLLAAGLRSSSVRLYEVATGRELSSPMGFNYLPIIPAPPFPTGAAVVAFSPDGRWLAYGHEGKIDGEIKRTLRVWDMDRKKQAEVLTEQHGITAAAFSPDGRLLAYGTGDQMLRLWDVSTGQLRTIGGQHGYINSISFAPDGSWLVFANTIYDVVTGRELGELDYLAGKGARPAHFAVSSDGRWLAFTVTDVSVVEGHTRSDRSIELWRMSETK